LDFVEGFFSGAHFKGGAHAGDIFGVGNPAVVFTFETRARVDGDERFAFDATRRDTWYGSLGDNGADSVFAVDGGLAALFFVGDVDEEFDEASVWSFGDVVGEGVDDDAAFAKEGFVIG